MTKFWDIEYVRPDFKRIKANLKRITKMAKNAKSYEEFKKAYFEVEKEVVELFSMTQIADVRSKINMNDKFYEEEIKYINTNTSILSLSLLKLINLGLKSPFLKDAEKEYGHHIVELLEGQAKMTNLKMLPFMIVEGNVVHSYSKEVAMCKTQFRGEECNFYGLLKHMESTDREERKEAFEAWAKMYEEVSPKLDEYYDKLVKIRVRKAKALGYKSFIDYVYPSRKRFDYTAKEVADFREKVRTEIVPLCQELFEKQRVRLGIDKLRYYDESLVFPEGNANPIGDRDELIEKARKMYEELSPESGEYFNFMVENQMYDLDTKPGKHLGGFCTFIPKYMAPFIFANFNGTAADVVVLTHEAGHGFETYEASRNQELLPLLTSSMEVNEIHSMAMELFTHPWMKNFFGDKTDKYLYQHYCDTITCIPYLVSVDEFQHRVFENPTMSAKDRRKVWSDIEKKYLPWRDYDGNKFLEEGGFWMQKQHIFMYPFYYVDYALAQICAFEFHIKGLKDEKGAWNDYLSLCKAGGSKGYFDLLKDANLDNPLFGDTVKNTIKEMRKIIDEAEKKIK